MSELTRDPKDKTFLITGGASGLGAEYAETFLKEGARNVAILDIAEQVGEAKAAQLNQVYPGNVIFIKCDVSKEDDIERAFTEVVSKFKQVDVIINNAGIMVDAPDMWRTACDVNWQGLVSFTMRGVKHMRKDEGGAGGTIVNISSTGALNKNKFIPIYCGSKMAVLHFGQSLAVEPFNTNTGIRILTICFGATDTPLLHGLENRTYDQKLGNVLVKDVDRRKPVFQKVESAVSAFVHMFKNGSPGSIWLSIKNNPAQDITPIIDNFFTELDKIVN